MRHRTLFRIFLIILLLSTVSFATYKHIIKPHLKKNLIVRKMDQVIRKPSVAGSFYPDTKKELYKQVSKYMNKDQPKGYQNVRALLVPHAGYIYSATVAAAAFREIHPRFNRVFILAANHNADTSFTGISIPEVSHYEIPGSIIPLDGIVDTLKKNKLFVNEPLAHTMHMLELELPFLNYLKGQPEKPAFTIIPMIAGLLNQEDIQKLASILNEFNDPETLFVFSVDLSHYFSADTANKLDTYTLKSLLSLNTNSLNKAVTDGSHVLQVLSTLAKMNNWKTALTMHSHSGKVNKNMDKVVGYGSMVFYDPLSFSKQEEHDILNFVRQTIEGYLVTGKTEPEKSTLQNKIPKLGTKLASFVTLKKNGTLRGCMGQLLPETSLIDSLHTNAINAAFKDPRFKDLTVNELNDITISVSILDYPQQIITNDPQKYPLLIKPGKDGIIIKYQDKSSTYLPSVWSEIEDPFIFLSSLCKKQGSPMICWQDPKAKLFRYTTYEFSE